MMLMLGSLNLREAKQNATQNNFNQFFSIYQQLDLKH